MVSNSNVCEILQILGVIHFLSGPRSCKSYTSISHLWSLLLYLVTPKSCIGGDKSNEYNFNFQGLDLNPLPLGGQASGETHE